MFTKTLDRTTKKKNQTSATKANFTEAAVVLEEPKQSENVDSTCVIEV